MKKIYTTLLSLLVPMMMSAQGWPANYEGVMLQAFYWDSFDQTNWYILEQQADELAGYFKLVWLPQSGNCGGQSMGYDDLYWFPGHYDSSFGTESELRSLISTFKSKGIGTIADVVINHRKSNNGWFGFPSETYKGVTYSMGPADVCGNDDGGKAKTEAQKLGVTLGANDTGEDWGGMRDLDHKGTNVQNICKAYTKMLIDDFGYVGFRYDMVKGYSASYTKMYNEYAKPTYSVGECWDGTNTIKNWINGSSKTSAAFDFQFKYVVRNATDKSDWTYLAKQNDGNWPLISKETEEGAYRRYAVTFVENHDTEVRPDGTSNGPLKKDTLAANAFMMAMPGTPCVFLKHWIDCKDEIKGMIDVRNFVGIHNESTYSQKGSNKNYYIVETIGSKGKLICSVGTKAEQYQATSQGYTKVLSGYHYVYWMSNSMETAWADKSSGTYENNDQKIEVMLSAVSATSGVQLVYTTNGSNPTASSTKVASGTKITISAGTTTLKVGLLKGSSVSGIITRTYTVKKPSSTEIVIPSFCKVNPGETCAFFEAPATWRNTIYCWAWIDNGSNFTGGTWPGEACTLLGTADNGNKVWKWTYKGTLTTKPQKIIFSNNGSPQTDNLTFKNGGYYTKDGFFDVVTGIEDIVNDRPAGPVRVYTLDGRLVANGQLETVSGQLPKGIYIVNGKKVVIK